MLQEAQEAWKQKAEAPTLAELQAQMEGERERWLPRVALPTSFSATVFDPPAINQRWIGLTIWDSDTAATTRKA